MDASGGADRAQRIQELMDEQGWKVAHLARVIGADPSRIYGWLKGEAIGSENLERLAVALETTRLYLESGKGPANYPRSSAPPVVVLKEVADALEALAPPSD